MTRPRALAAAGLALALAACGFHLQGTARLPPTLERTYLAGDRYTEFNRALTDSLRVAGVRLATAQDDATAVVELLEDDTGQRVLSVSARNTPGEYEVYYTVRYRVTAAGRELLPAQSLTLTREYSFDETALLAKEREQELLREALARELAALVMRRLAALPPSAPAPAAPVPAPAAPATSP
ncbi:MAG: LPS assembly lipoprotein LptE [Pseudomonadota bacterium]